MCSVEALDDGVSAQPGKLRPRQWPRATTEAAAVPPAQEEGHTKKAAPANATRRLLRSVVRLASGRGVSLHQEQPAFRRCTESRRCPRPSYQRQKMRATESRLPALRSKHCGPESSAPDCDA